MKSDSSLRPDDRAQRFAHIEWVVAVSDLLIHVPLETLELTRIYRRPRQPIT